MKHINFPDRYETYLDFDYNDEYIEIGISYKIYGDSIAGYEIDLNIIENKTDYTDQELENYILDNNELVDEIFNNQEKQYLDLVMKAEDDYD